MPMAVSATVSLSCEVSLVSYAISATVSVGCEIFLVLCTISGTVSLSCELLSFRVPSLQLFQSTLSYLSFHMASLQLFHLAARYHQFMPISCHFRDCEVLLVTGLLEPYIFYLLLTYLLALCWVSKFRYRRVEWDLFVSVCLSVSLCVCISSGGVYDSVLYKSTFTYLLRPLHGPRPVPAHWFLGPSRLGPWAAKTY